MGGLHLLISRDSTKNSAKKVWNTTLYAPTSSHPTTCVAISPSAFLACPTSRTRQQSTGTGADPLTDETDHRRHARL